MKIRMQLVLTALLAGCASAPLPMAESSPAPAVRTSAAAPQQVNAVSEALGQRLDGMLTALPISATVTR